MPRKAREGETVITSSTVCERHGEGLAETGSIRYICSTEGTRGGLVTNSTNVTEGPGAEETGETDWTRSNCCAEGTRRSTSDFKYHCVPTDMEKNQRRVVQPKSSVSGRHEREDQGLLAPMCPQKHGEGQAETCSNSGNYAAEGTRGGLVTNSNNASRKTRRRTSADGHNQKQVYRWRQGEEERAETDWTRSNQLNQKQSWRRLIEPESIRGSHETEDQWLLVPICPEKHGE